MASVLSVLALALPLAHSAPCDRDCRAAKLPPCETTCTGAERRGMARESAELRRRLSRLRVWRHWAATVDPYRDWLGRLRACESGGDWRIVNSLGYAGAYQFGSWAWAAAGGEGRPQDAHPLEQSYRAVVLRRAYGLSQWECKVGA